MPLPASASGFVVSDALPVMAVIAVSGIVALGIAAWVVRDIARFALQRSTEADIPRVLVALGGWLEQLRLFLPWQSGELRRRTSLPPDGPHAGDTNQAPDLSKEGSR
jgi:prepilin signal peptidase PulO-like enzyme (type II secretory pathway)